MLKQETLIRFLGTGDSMGVPRVYCDCKVCQEARKGGLNRRLRSSIMLESGRDELLVDCGPDWQLQMELLGKRTVGDILITHAHFDHIGGLPELADLCRWTGEKRMLYAPAEVLAVIDRQFPWLQRVLSFREADGGLELLGWRAEPFRVNHGKNGYSYAYRFEREGKAWVYCPDSIGLDAEAKARMKGLALLILGTSFYREEADYHTRSVYDMVEALELLEELRPGECWFTHMSHGVDAENPPSLPLGVHLAEYNRIIRL